MFVPETMIAPLRETLVEENRPPALTAVPLVLAPRMIEPRSLSINPVASLTTLFGTEVKLDEKARKPRTPGTVLSDAPVAPHQCDLIARGEITCPSTEARWPAFSIAGAARRI